MKLEPPGTWWHLHGWIALAGSFVLMIYYTTISGWMVDYFVRFLDGSFQGLSTKEVADVFGSMLANPTELLGFMGLNVLIGFAVCAGGASWGRAVHGAARGGGLRPVGGVACLLGRRGVGAHHRAGVGALNRLLVGLVGGLWRHANCRGRLVGVDGAVVGRLRKSAGGGHCQCQCRAAQ